MKSASTITGQEYLPPHSIDSEQSVLGSMLIERLAIDKAMEMLLAEDFYREGHQLLFRVICDLSLANEPVDPITLQNSLRGLGIVEVTGGIEYILSLFQVVPTAANVAFYAEIVREKAALRRMGKAAMEVLALSTQEDKRSDDLIEQAEARMYALKRRGQEDTGSVIGDTLVAFEERMASVEQGATVTPGLMTGLSDFDRTTNGLKRNQLVVVAARPSMGKTACLTAMSVGITLSSGLPCYIHSAEMDRDEIFGRIICSMAGVEWSNLDKQQLTEEEWNRYHEAAALIRTMPLFVDEKIEPTPAYIRSTARRVVSMFGGLGSIFVDYIGLMQADRPTDNSVNDLGTIAYDLKTLAREMKVPVIVLSQLNRASESRENKRPTLSDIRQSGKIEEAADIVVGLYREEYYRQRQPGAEPPSDQIEELELIFLKHRNGPTRTARSGFLARYAQLVDIPGMGDGPTGF